VHAVLQLAWNELKTSSKLRAKSDDRLAELVENSVDAVLADNGWLASAGLLQPTRAWLADIAMAWLLYERDQRVGDWKVLATEARTSATLGSLEIRSMRIDRIDEMPDGSLAVIDYKTSASVPSPSSWLGDRPSDPQLPLYALAVEQQGTADGSLPAGQHVSIAAFASLVARDEVAFRGPPARPLDGRKPRKDKKWLGWDEQTAQWRSTFERLAKDYAAGRAPVDPFKTKACDYCKRQSLCRVFEGQVEDDDGEGER